MSGMAGYLDTSAAGPEVATLERMIDRIRYRGPEDQGVWSRGSGVTGGGR